MRGEILIIVYVAAFSFFAITTTYFEAQWSRKGAENIGKNPIVKETANNLYASAVSDSTFSKIATKVYDTYGGGVEQRLSNMNDIDPMLRSEDTNLRGNIRESERRPLYLDELSAKAITITDEKNTLVDRGYGMYTFEHKSSK